MRTRTDIESFLLRSEVSYDQVGSEDMWLVTAGHGENIIISLAETIVIIRSKVVDLDEVTDKPALFETLLDLNTADLVHAAYGLSDGAVVLTCAMQMQNLDYNEFQAALDDIALGLANHHDAIGKYRKS